MKIFGASFLLLLFSAFGVFSQSLDEASTACGKKDFSCQIAEITVLINAKPLAAENYVKRGNLYLEIENYFVAHRDFSKAIEINPTYAEAYIGKGNAFFNENNLPAAFDEYNKILKFNPKYAEVYYRIASIYAFRANYPKAIENLDKAIELDPERHEFYYGRGYVYLFLERCVEGLKDFHQSVKLKPDFIGGYVGLGICFRETGNKTEMAKAFDFVIEQTTKNIENDPNDYGSFIQRGLAFYKETTPDGDDPQVQDFYSAITINPRGFFAYQYLGLNSYNKGKHIEAVGYFSKAIELEPELAELYRYRAYAYQHLKDRTKAAADLQKYNDLSRKPLKP